VRELNNFRTLGAGSRAFAPRVSFDSPARVRASSSSRSSAATISASARASGLSFRPRVRLLLRLFLFLYTCISDHSLVILPGDHERAEDHHKRSAGAFCQNAPQDRHQTLAAPGSDQRGPRSSPRWSLLLRSRLPHFARRPRTMGRRRSPRGRLNGPWHLNQPKKRLRERNTRPRPHDNSIRGDPP
jgi:hypothetical protein